MTTGEDSSLSDADNTLTNTLTNSQAARFLLKSQSSGVLSTISADLDGYPFGSLTPYCTDQNGYPIILISHLAQHTKNITDNNKVSLYISTASHQDSQQNARLTYVADAIKMQPETEPNDGFAKDRYLRFFPQSEEYYTQLNFHFYRLSFVKARFINGFGKACWISEDNLCQSSVISADREQAMIAHMNQDHQEANRHYLRQIGLAPAEDEAVAMVAIDNEGFNLRVDSAIYRIAFSIPVKDANEVRERLVELARR